MTYSREPITAQQVRTAWDLRGSEPDASFRLLHRARDQRTLTELSAQCGAPKYEVREFLDGATVESSEVQELREQLALSPGERDHGKIAGMITELRQRGRSLEQIGRSVGLSRQRIAVLSGGKPDTAEPTPSKRRKPPAPCYRQPRSLTPEQLQPLHSAYDRYRTSQRSPAEQRDAELTLVRTAIHMQNEFRTPLGALSAHLGLPRHSLAAMSSRLTSAA